MLNHLKQEMLIVLAVKASDRIRMVTDEACFLPGETKITQKLTYITTMIKPPPLTVDEVLNQKADPASIVISILYWGREQALLQFPLLYLAEFRLSISRDNIHPAYLPYYRGVRVNVKTKNKDTVQ